MSRKLEIIVLNSQAEFDAALVENAGELSVRLKSGVRFELHVQRTILVLDGALSAMSEGAVARAMNEGAVAEAMGEGAVAEAMNEGAVARALSEGAVAEAMNEGAVAKAMGEGAVAEAMSKGAVAEAWGDGAVAEAWYDGAVAVQCGKAWDGPIPPGTPVIPDLNSKVFDACQVEGAVDMEDWHTCPTTHCHGGWMIHLGGARGLKLQAKHGEFYAAAAIFSASCPGQPIPNFWATNEQGMKNIAKLARKK